MLLLLQKQDYTHTTTFYIAHRSIEDDSIESGNPDANVSQGDDMNNQPQPQQQQPQQLMRHSCHDSGIDITDPNIVLPGVQSKKNYSDADIVLSSDWVPPLTIAPTLLTETFPSALNSSTQPSSLDSGGGGGGGGGVVVGPSAATVIGGRKKTSSVSFSVDDNSEQHSSTSSEKSTDNRKNKMLKRLSYPLTWVEGLTGEGKPNESESAPNTGDSNQSVFSKVFSR